MLKRAPELEQPTVPARPAGRPGLALAKVAMQLVLVFAILSGAVAAMQWLVDTAPQKPPRQAFRTVYPVTVMAAQAGYNRPDIHVFGQAVAARSVDLRPLVAGEVAAVSDRLVAGARVDVGDMLLQIDPFDYEVAVAEANTNLAQTEAAIAEIEARIASERGQLEAALQQLELARSDLARAETLAATGALTSKQLDDRKLIVSQREQSARQRRSNLQIEDARLQQQRVAAERLRWKVRLAERNLGDTVLRAPFAGVVRQASAQAGKTVSQNDVVASLYSDAEIEAKFTLTDAQYQRLATDSDPLIGRTVSATWTIGGRSYRYDGRIERVGAEIDSTRGGVELFALLQPQAEALALRPGAFLELVVADRGYDDSFRFPETAVHEGRYVYVVADGQLVRREVQILAYDGDDAILRGPLAAGETVMTTRLSEAYEGAAVVIEDTAPASRPDAPVN